MRADVAVVGAGAAGLYAALVASREGAHVTLVSRSPLAQTASYWAQGGIAAALADEDSPELHAQDIRVGFRRFAALEPEPVAALKLALDRRDPARPLRMRPRVVPKRGLVTEVERRRDGATVEPLGS